MVVNGMMNETKYDPNKTIPTIREFYENSTIFITGGTGFIGKVLVEKLLRTYAPKRIYLLVRDKDNMNVEQRMDKYLKESIFDDIRKYSPEKLNKLHPISANFSAFNLGISKNDQTLLVDEVEIVFNVVASVKFNEKLSDAIAINVLGTKKIVDIVLKMKRLKVFLHISTLYSNCNHKSIEERIYESKIGYHKVIQLYKMLDSNELEKLRHCLVDDQPNTYTFTKHCSESLVSHKTREIPSGVFRPPIVLSTYKEPFPGWTDNLYGPSGICVSIARGYMHSIYGCGSKKANLVPADFCVNAMIASAWDIAFMFTERKAQQQGRSEIPVYNYIFDSNNLTWGSYVHLARQGFHEPFDKTLWCFSYIIVPYKLVHRLTAFVLHYIPGYALDMVAMLTGHKKIYVQAYNRVTEVFEMMSYFGLREWKVTNKNITDLDAKIHEDDRKDIEFNLAKINWKEYFQTYLSGIKKYIYKDTERNITRRKTYYRRLLILHVLIKTLLGFWGIILTSKIIRRLLSSNKFRQMFRITDSFWYT